MQEIPTFDMWPRIEDLLSNGGLPGVEYCIVPAENVVRRRAQGLVPIEGRTAQGFRIQHQDKLVDCVLMGEGEPIRGAAPESGVSLLSFDNDLRDMLGAEEPPKKRGPGRPRKNPEAA